MQRALKMSSGLYTGENFKQIIFEKKSEGKLEALFAIMIFHLYNLKI